MITVSILINGQPIFTRSAVNRGATENGHRYEVDDGPPDIIYRRELGAIPLAIKMLERIKEQKGEKSK